MKIAICTILLILILSMPVFSGISLYNSVDGLDRGVFTDVLLLRGADIVAPGQIFTANSFLVSVALAVDAGVSTAGASCGVSDRFERGPGGSSERASGGGNGSVVLVDCPVVAGEGFLARSTNMDAGVTVCDLPAVPGAIAMGVVGFFVCH